MNAICLHGNVRKIFRFGFSGPICLTSSTTSSCCVVAVTGTSSASFSCCLVAVVAGTGIELKNAPSGERLQGAAGFAWRIIFQLPDI